MHESIHPDYIGFVHQERLTRLSRRRARALRNPEWAGLLGPIGER